MRLAALLAKVAAQRRRSVPGAPGPACGHAGRCRALGLERTLGSLVPGKAADIVAVDLSGIDALPCYDPVSHLVHAVGRDAVTDVWVGGRRVVANRALTTVDEGAIVSRARVWQEQAAMTTTMSTTSTTANVDAGELAKFGALAHHWWDPDSVMFGPLHKINPLRARLDRRRSPAVSPGKRIVDVGCGGGILSEALAAAGAAVVGIDLGEKALGVAKLHQLESGSGVDYRIVAAETLASEMPAAFDVVTCMELVEHVPDPASIIAACAALAKPGGLVVISTINRNPKAYALAILGAEYVLQMLPRGTHDYAKFLTPAEVGALRAARRPRRSRHHRR